MWGKDIQGQRGEGLIKVLARCIMLITSVPPMGLDKSSRRFWEFGDLITAGGDRGGHWGTVEHMESIWGRVF